MTSSQEKRWWFSVTLADVLAAPIRVERFETSEQALLHAAATGGFVPFVHNLLDAGPYAAKRAYDFYFALSEPTK